MERSKSTDAAALVGALLAGVAIGATIGILFAPAKGSETRKKLSSGGEDLTDELTDKFNDLLDKFKGEFEAAKGKLAEIGEKGGKAAADAKESKTA